MPEPSTLALFALAALALVVVPGPNAIYIATRSLGQGRSAGLASAAGVQVGTVVHVAAAAAGLSALVASSSAAFTAVKYAGAAYLVILGLRALLHPAGPPLDADGGPAVTLRRVFAAGVLVNVLNPKVALFFVAFLPQFLAPDRGSVALQVVVLGMVMVAIGLVLDVLYALTAGALGAKLRERPGFGRRQGWFTGPVYLALGAAAALSGDGRRR